MINANRRGQESGELKHTFLKVAARLEADVDGIQKSMQRIRQACHTPGTKGSCHQALLHGTAENLVRLSLLYGSAANRLRVAAEGLSTASPEDKQLNDVLAFARFLGDQLECEERGIRSTLATLSGNRPSSSHAR